MHQEPRTTEIMACHFVTHVWPVARFLPQRYHAMCVQAARRSRAIVALPRKDYKILRSMLAQRASDKSRILQDQAAQLEGQVSAVEAQKREQAELLVDIQLVGGMEAAEAGMVRDLSETDARLTGVKRDREECDVERRAVQAVMERNGANL